MFSDYIGRAFDTTLWPVLGFFFMPLITLAYAWAINSGESVEGVPLVDEVGRALSLRRPPQLGHTARPFHENGTRRSSPQPTQ